MNWIIDPSKRIKMPLGGPTEPVDALEQVVRTHPSGDDIKRISDLLMAIARKCQEKPKDLHKFRKLLEKFDEKLGNRNTDPKVSDRDDGTADTLS